MSFSFSVRPSNVYSELITFRIDWLDLLAKGTLKSLLQHHNWKASILRCSAFSMVQAYGIYQQPASASLLSFSGPSEYLEWKVHDNGVLIDRNCCLLTAQRCLLNKLDL